MVDFDELKSKAESLLGEHADQVEGGIDKLADLAGKQFGHTGQIDSAADKLKGFVADRAAATPGPTKKAPAKKAPGKKAPAKKAAAKKAQPPRRGGGPAR